MLNLAISDCSTQVFTKSLSHHHSENIETYDTGRFFCNLAVDVHSISQKNTCINLFGLTVEYDDNRFNRCLLFFLPIGVFISQPVSSSSQSQSVFFHAVPLLRPANQSAHNGHDAQQSPSSSNWRPMRREGLFLGDVVAILNAESS